MEFFFEDCKGFIFNPRETFKRIATYESLLVPAVLIFLCGAIDGLKRFSIASNVTPEQIGIMLPYQVGLLTSDKVMAFLTPFLLLSAWILTAWLSNAVADKVGARSGDFASLLMTTGYLALPVLPYTIISFFLTALARTSRIFLSIDILVLGAFLVWLFYLWMVMISQVCDLAMMHAAVTVLATALVVGFVYYTLFELLLRSIMASLFQPGRR